LARFGPRFRAIDPSTCKHQLFLAGLNRIKPDQPGSRRAWLHGWELFCLTQPRKTFGASGRKGPKPWEGQEGRAQAGHPAASEYVKERRPSRFAVPPPQRYGAASRRDESAAANGARKM